MDLSESKERVAYDLAQLISKGETIHKHDREYFFRLYYQCLRLVNGEKPESLLESEMLAKALNQAQAFTR